MAKTTQREIRADFDRETIVVYQAYADKIADPALKARKFVAPFSFTRMTWIKPSFLWLMERSNWGQKAGQERILAVRITRQGWQHALEHAVLTNYERTAHASPEQWRRDLDSALVHIQWDPERSIRGASLEIESIQLGLSRNVIGDFADTWTREIVDMTPLVRKMRRMIDAGDNQKAKAHLPPERIYPIDDVALRRRLGMGV
jgi:hypothetical protein